MLFFENGEGKNIRFAKYPALCKRGLKHNPHCNKTVCVSHSLYSF